MGLFLGANKWGSGGCNRQFTVLATPPEGGTPLYKPYRYVPPQRVGFLRPFGLKTGIDFAHFGLESTMVYKGTMVVY